MIKYVISVFLLAIVVVITIQLYGLNQQRLSLREDLKSLSAETKELREEKGRVLNEIEYFQNDENLEKELKSKFNYRRLGEKMYILVPAPEE